MNTVPMEKTDALILLGTNVLINLKNILKMPISNFCLLAEYNRNNISVSYILLWFPFR